MPRTNVVLEESRVSELKKLTGARTKAEAVREAVEMAIRRAKVLLLQKRKTPLHFDPTDRRAEEERRHKALG